MAGLGKDQTCRLVRKRTEVMLGYAAQHGYNLKQWSAAKENDLDDAALMKEALRVAERGRGLVEPNPLVGAVIARRGVVLSRGWHHRFGEAHAEVDALRKLGGPPPADAVMYVTLEPCCHHGKTPPCTKALIKAGIKEVVVATLDPNPRVNGKGVAELRKAGVKVRVGVMEEEARYQNAPYFKRTRTGLPFVTLKWAMSLDGKTATRSGQSRWISNQRSRILAHKLRAVSDVVMVGVGTVLADDPLLTARLFPPQRQQKRVVVDSRGRTPLTSAVVLTAHETPTIIATTRHCPRERAEALRKAGCRVVRLPAKQKRVDMKALLSWLGKQDVTNVLVEGGGSVAASLIEANLVDRIICFIAPVIIGGADAVTPVEGTGVEKVEDALRGRITEIKTLNDNLCIQCDLPMPYLQG